MFLGNYLAHLQKYWTVCYSLWYNAPTMLPAHRQSSVPEDVRNRRPKHVELIEIINKPLLLNLVGFLYYCNSDARSNKFQRRCGLTLLIEQIPKKLYSCLSSLAVFSKPGKSSIFTGRAKILRIPNLSVWVWQSSISSVGREESLVKRLRIDHNRFTHGQLLRGKTYVSLHILQTTSPPFLHSFESISLWRATQRLSSSGYVDRYLDILIGTYQMFQHLSTVTSW